MFKILEHLSDVVRTWQQQPSRVFPSSDYRYNSSSFPALRCNLGKLIIYDKFYDVQIRLIQVCQGVATREINYLARTPTFKASFASGVLYIITMRQMTTNVPRTAAKRKSLGQLYMFLRSLAINNKWPPSACCRSRDISRICLRLEDSDCYSRFVSP